MPWSTWKRLVQNKKWVIFFLPTVNAYQYLTSLKVCAWSGHIFGASASPRSLTKAMAMSPSSTVYRGQHDTKYVTFELLMHVAFVADEIWGFYAWTNSYHSCFFFSRKSYEMEFYFFPKKALESCVWCFDHHLWFLGLFIGWTSLMASCSYY